MKQGHLSEYQIQQYLDGPQAEYPDITVHLTECAVCREALEAYRSVYDTLAEPPVIPLNINLRSRVMAQLQPERRFRFSFETGFSILFFLISMATVGYLTGFSVDMALISGFFSTLLGELSRINLRFLSDNMLFILVPLLIIIVIELLDKKILKLKY